MTLEEHQRQHELADEAARLGFTETARAMRHFADQMMYPKGERETEAR